MIEIHRVEALGRLIVITAIPSVTSRSMDTGAFPVRVREIYS